MATRKTAKYRTRANRGGKAAANGVVATEAPTGHVNGAGATATPCYPTYEEIQTHAYELFMARGGMHGDDLADWFAAENDLKAMSALK